MNKEVGASFVVGGEVVFETTIYTSQQIYRGLMRNQQQSAAPNESQKITIFRGQSSNFDQEELDGESSDGMSDDSDDLEMDFKSKRLSS